MFRFTIRDLLWLTVVVALAISWWIDNKRIENTVAKLEKEGRLQREARDDELIVLKELEAEHRTLVEQWRKGNPPIVVYPPPPRVSSPMRNQLP